MEKEFVPYEQALALKELGFDEPCLYGYDTFATVISTSTKWENWNQSLQLVSAPLYQQVFRWFREKYNLDSFVKHLYKSTIKVGYYFGIDEYNGIEFQMELDGYYETYEEAELECLVKLIDIVKKQNLN
jgi:hypothetical protein